MGPQRVGDKTKITTSTIVSVLNWELIMNNKYNNVDTRWIKGKINIDSK